MMKLKTDIIGFLPFFVIATITSVRLIWSTSFISLYPFLISISIAFLLAASSLFLFLVARSHVITRVFLVILGWGLLALGIIYAAVGMFKGMYILIFSCFYEGVYPFFIIHDLVKSLRGKRNALSKTGWIKKMTTKTSLNKEQDKEMGIDTRKRKAITAFFLIGTSIFAIFAIDSTWIGPKEKFSFTVSANEMKDKEIALYWVRQSMDDPAEFVKILKDTNTTLLLQGNPDLFLGIGEYSTKGADAANLVKLCNDAGVKVEIWPVPSQSEPCALSLRYVDCMPTVYEYFKNWTRTFNITVDYYAFDIEDFNLYPMPFDSTPIGKTLTPGSPLYYTFQSIYEYSAKQEFLRTNCSNWNQMIEKQQLLVNQIIKDGITPRATIFACTWDVFDGDLTEYKKNFLQSYEIKGYEYLSAMVYRSCEGGGNRSSYQVYNGVKMLRAVSPYEKTAVCIGCIAYPAYKTSQDVANDVWLSVGAGADSVRIFLGDSWVYSAANESVGLNNLRTMLELCRGGGTGSAIRDPSIDASMFSSVFTDVFGDW
ncbi:MAG: hypothetical protein ACTSVI_06295 [Promethearchaeota archaeon]